MTSTELQRYKAQEQREIEHNHLAVTEWINRQRRKAGSDQDIGKSLYNAAVEPVSGHIAIAMTHQADKSARYYENWYRLVNDQDPDILAALAVLVMLDHSIGTHKYDDEKFRWVHTTKTARRIGEAVQRHIFWADYVAATNAKQRQRLEDEVNEQDTEWARIRVQERAYEDAGRYSISGSP
jgi:hypothetical protein